MHRCCLPLGLQLRGTATGAGLTQCALGELCKCKGSDLDRPPRPCGCSSHAACCADASRCVGWHTALCTHFRRCAAAFAAAITATAEAAEQPECDLAALTVVCE